jgi:uncharacterized membrane protein
MDMLIPSSIVFLLSHFFPSTGLKARAVAAVGQRAYLGIYSAVSLAALVWLVYEFEAEPYGDRIWTLGDWWYWVKPVMILFALFLLTSGLAAPNPMIPRGGGFVTLSRAPHNVLAITRHPLMWGLGLWAIAHLVSQPTWRGFWFFGAFAIMAPAGAWLHERRAAAEYGGAWQNFRRYTSFLPFAAIITGRASVHLNTLGWRPVIAAIALWLAILLMHARLFNQVPIPQLGMWLS